MTRNKTNKGKKTSKLASIKYCEVCKSTHAGPINHRCLVAGSKKVAAYVLANNLSPEVFDNSSSDSVPDVVPPTPRASDDMNMTAPRDPAPTGATPSVSEADNHVRNLFSPSHITSPVANAQVSFDTASASDAQAEMPPPSHHASPNVAISACTNPPSNVQSITPQSAPPAGAIISELGQSEPRNQWQGNRPRFTFQVANGANNPSGGSGQLLSALRAARVDVASYDPNAPRPPRAQSAPAPMPRFVRFLSAPNTRFIFASSGSVNANTTATQQVPVTPECTSPGSEQ